ncbi:aminotransferase class V-fold PLP-dependent enzyme [Pseudomonas asplenii]|uniref:aminotransferase class V-fold PLP-dependent enzyme n=1 Tax=Pseudomonas asplenii TaxID=53407 RepID=UPI000373B9FB|nr:aminotransferase class V-fold PLP-dependent enzyme [Pseudomonas fuscovaginae]
MPRNQDNARDEHFWQAVAQRYDVEPGPINLENGYFGRMSRRVIEAYQRNIDFINRSNSVHVRQHFDQVGIVDIRAELAELMGISDQAITFSQNATASLQTLIRNYNRLQPGDQVLYSDLEYETVKSALNWLERYRGVQVIRIEHTHPASYETLLASYREAFVRHPRLKLMALTHVTHRTGLVMPVQAIVEMATGHGVDVILDGAHALGQIDFDLPALGVAFAGFNLQKWIGAPLSLGVTYIAPERLADIDPDMGETHFPLTDIRSRTPHSTPNIPALMTLPTVFAEHRELGGAAAKGARLRYLRDLWVGQARQMPGIEVLIPDDPRLYGAITSLRFTRQADQQVMVDRLLREYNLFTVTRSGSACGPCVRITPGFTTSVQDMLQLVRALAELSG